MHIGTCIPKFKPELQTLGVKASCFGSIKKAVLVEVPLMKMWYDCSHSAKRVIPLGRIGRPSSVLEAKLHHRPSRRDPTVAKLISVFWPV